MGATTISNGIVDITLVHHTDDNVTIAIQAYIVANICGRMPYKRFDSPFANTIEDSKLADPTFNRPGMIELLLGAGALAAIINEDLHRSSSNNNHAVAQSTLFGWVIYGQIPSAAHVRLQNCTTTVECDDAKLDQLLLRFWNADAMPEDRQWTVEEKRAEDIFVRTHTRDQKTGRYTVRVPLRSDARPLGNSISAARACFYGIEKSFIRDSQLHAKYKAVFDDYRALHHMVLAPQRPKDDAESYFLPHHPINVASEKGKFRVVFNASATTSTGVRHRVSHITINSYPDRNCKMI